MRYALHNNEDSSERRFKTLKELWSYVRKHDLCSEQVDVTGMADAQKLLAFLVSNAGQQTIAHSQSWEYPLRPGVSPAKGLAPLSSFHATSLTPAELGNGSEALEMEQRLGLL